MVGGTSRSYVASYITLFFPNSLDSIKRMARTYLFEQRPWLGGFTTIVLVPIQYPFFTKIEQLVLLTELTFLEGYLCRVRPVP